MIRRLLSACLTTAALAGVLGMPARSAAKPPDLPKDQNDTVTPKVAPEVEGPSGGAVVSQPESEPIIPDLISVMPRQAAVPMRAHPLMERVLVPPPMEDVAGIICWSRLNGCVYILKDGRDSEGICPTFVQKAVEEELPPAPSLYDVLPAALPTPALYQLRPTARRTLVGSLLFGINPLLALLPTDKALDAPDDHPQCVAGEDFFQSMPNAPPHTGCYGIGNSGACTLQFGGGDWLKWLASYWAARYGSPSPEQNEGYIHAINANTDIAGLTSADAPDGQEVDWPLTPSAEPLPPPQEDTPHKKKHKKHHRQAERLPMPREDDSAEITCPYLRQQAADRHACQFADPDIGREVLDNLERLTEAENLLKQAEEFVQAGRIDEALECCGRAREMCPGSPCAARAEAMLLELSFIRSYVQPAGAEDAAEEKSGDSPGSEQAGVEEQVRGLMKACRLLMGEGLHEQAAELARQAFALDPQRVMADPLFYKMHLLATTPARTPAGSSESSEPPSCPYCPHAGKPITGIVPDKKRTSNFAELTEAIAREPGRPVFDLHIGADGGVRLRGQCTCGGAVYHVKYNQGRLTIWKAPDAATVKP